MVIDKQNNQSKKISTIQCVHPMARSKDVEPLIRRKFQLEKALNIFDYFSHRSLNHIVECQVSITLLKREIAVLNTVLLEKLRIGKILGFEPEYVDYNFWDRDINNKRQLKEATETYNHRLRKLLKKRPITKTSKLYYSKRIQKILENDEYIKNIRFYYNGKEVREINEKEFSFL